MSSLSFNKKKIMGYKQVSKTMGSMDDHDENSSTADEVSTVIADKTHLANLISSLKSEMASANALLKSKEHDYNEAKTQVNRFKDDLNDANKRMAALEKQCEQYRQTVSVRKSSESYEPILIISFFGVAIPVPLDQTFGRSFENICRYN